MKLLRSLGQFRNVLVFERFSSNSSIQCKHCTDEFAFLILTFYVRTVHAAYLGNVKIYSGYECTSEGSLSDSQYLNSSGVC